MMSTSINSFISSVKNGQKPLYKPVLKAETKTFKKDTFENSSKEKNADFKKKNSRILTFAGIGAGISAIAFLIYKNKISKVVGISKNISFKKAKTVEEAKRFGAKAFGIQTYTGFDEADIDAINWFNEGVFNIAKKYKGANLRMPKKVLYEDMENTVTVAGVVNDSSSEYHNYFFINKRFFYMIEQELARSFRTSQHNFAFLNPDCTKITDIFKNEKLSELLDKYYKNTLNFNDKIQLTNFISHLYDIVNTLKKSPINYIEKFYAQLSDDTRKKFNIPDIKTIKKLSKEEQFSMFKRIFCIAGVQNHGVKFDVEDVSPFEVIYHEFGHLQDMVKRPPAKELFDFPTLYPPELRDWLSDTRKIEIANSISEYSASGPGEFVADVYARLLGGAKVNDKALALYKELNGPSIPGII